MIGFPRAGQPGYYLTRISDIQCPRVDPCGYRCEAGVGGHDLPHLFEEHEHKPITPSIVEHCMGCGGSVSSMGGLDVYDCPGI